MQPITLTPIVGLPQFDGWSQVTSNADHSFVCVFSIRGDNAGNVGRDVVDMLNQFSPHDAHHFHQNLAEVDQFVTEKECRLAITGALFIEETCYLGAKLGGICLKRGSKVGKLVVADSAIAVVEGTYKKEDVFVLYTQEAESFYGEIQQKLSQGYDVDTIITSIVPGLRSLENSALCALGFLQVSPVETEPSVAVAPVDEDDIVLDEDTHSQAEPEAENATAVHTTYDPTSDKYFDGSEILQKTSVVSTPKQSLVGRLKRFFLTLFNSREKIKLTSSKKKLAESRLAFKKKFTFSGSQKKKIILILTSLVVIGGIGGGALYWHYSQVQAEVTAETQKLAPYRQRLEAAKTQAETDPIVVRDEVSSILSDLTAETQRVEQNKPVLEVAQELLTETQTFYDSIAGQEEVNQLPLFYDLRLVESDFVAQSAQVSEGKAYFFDAEKGHIIQLDLASKQSEPFEVKDGSNARDFGVNGNSAFILKEGILRFGLKDQTTVKIIPESDTNRAATELRTFGSFLYLLVPESRNIYKYTDDEDGTYADPVSWIRSAKGIDMDQVLSFAVDGDIWLTDKEGHIYRLRSGNRIDFEVKGLPEPFENSLLIETKEDDQYMYILEANKQRLVVIDKDGQFIKEVKSNSLASGTVLMVDEPNHTAYVVSGSEVFSIQL